MNRSNVPRAALLAAITVGMTSATTWASPPPLPGSGGRVRKPAPPPPKQPAEPEPAARPQERVQRPPTPPAAASEGSLRFESRTVDAGERLALAPVEVSFPFTNTGAEPVRILSIRSSCGCTAANSSGMLIGPGESGAIQAIFNPAGRTGDQHKIVTVRTDDPAAPEIRLTLNCSVRPAVTTEPEVLILRDVEEGHGAELAFQVHPAPGLRIRRVRLEGADLQLVHDLGKGAAVDELADDENQEPDGEAWKVILPKGAGEGTITGTLVVEFEDQSFANPTDPSGLPDHKQPVSFQVVGPYAAAPSVLVTRQYGDDQSSSFDVKLSRRDGKAFQVLRWAISEAPEASGGLSWTDIAEDSKSKAAEHALQLTPDVSGLKTSSSSSSSARLWTGWLIVEAQAEDGRRHVKIPARIFLRSARRSEAR